MTSSRELERFYKSYVRALNDGSAALFAGAGLSVPAGHINWKDLLRPLANELHLDVDQETDLPALAQFYVNEDGGSRAVVNQHILDALTQNVSLTESHRLLAKLPIYTVWTTNYDDLLERSFEEAGRYPDVKRRPTSLPLTRQGRDVAIYKMHGDTTEPESAVITKDDYESYNEKRQLFLTTLQADLATKTFLFLGFSFSDPNLSYVLSRLRSLLGNNTKTHYWIEKRKDSASSATERRRQELQIDDLRRYGIRCLLLDDYKEIPEILKALHARTRLRNIFVSGSVEEYGAMDKDRYGTMGKDRVERFIATLGSEIIKRGYNLLTGLGRGIGDSVYYGAFKARRENPQSARIGRLEPRPMPRGVPAPDKFNVYKEWREQILSKVGFTILLCGNRKDESGNSIASPGVLQEFEIAKKEGCRIIPVAATGHGTAASAAVKIWEEVRNNLAKFYPEGGVEQHFDVLNDPSKSDKELIEAIFAIIDRVRS